MLPKLSVASGICTFAHVSLCVCACVCSLTNVHLCTSHRYWDFVTEPRLVAGLSRAKADNCISGAPWPQTKHLCYYFLWPLRKPLPFLRLNFQIDFFSPQSQVMHSWLAVHLFGPLFLERSFRNSDRQKPLGVDKWYSLFPLAYKWRPLLFLNVARLDVVFLLPACMPVTVYKVWNPVWVYGCDRVWGRLVLWYRTRMKICKYPSVCLWVTWERSIRAMLGTVAE